MESVAGVSLGAAASWASAGAGQSASPAPKTKTPKRQTAFINSRFLLVNRAMCARSPCLPIARYSSIAKMNESGIHPRCA
jgi:hypothetical protein